jgi:ornithine carbamoyltransferase
VTRHLLADSDLSAVEQSDILALAAECKRDRLSRTPLRGKSVALIFEKPSTRTRFSFEVGVYELGGHPLVVDAQTTQIGRGETLEDTAAVLSRYVHAIVLRTAAHERVARLAAAASVPVVNSLSDDFHPCQALADLLTIREHIGGPTGVTLTYLGDGNNVAHSLLVAGAIAGMHVRTACPPGFQPAVDVVATATGIAAATGGSITITTDPRAASENADVLYTDVWTSMGQETEAASRIEPFLPYALDAEKVRLAAPDVLVMHCLPAHRGEEISAEAADGPRSVIFDQAENRLHAQKALLCWLAERAS